MADDNTPPAIIPPITVKITSIQSLNEDQTLVLIKSLDSDDTTSAWPVEDWRKDEVNAWLAIAGHAVVPFVPDLVAIAEDLCDMVDAERERRIADGYVFQGKTYQLRPKDLDNLNGSVGAAILAKMTNSDGPGNLRWADAEHDFGWIAEDNTITPMDADTLILFGRGALAYVSRLVFTGLAIKTAIRAGNPPSDVTLDAIWS